MAIHNTKLKHQDLTEYRKTSIYPKLKEARLRNNKKLFKIMKEEGISFDI